jgi:hypothetical protein
MLRSIFVVLPLIAATQAYARSIDAYLAPLVVVGLPLHEFENSFASAGNDGSPEPRIGFRVEAGLLNENLSVDFRFASRSRYQDYGGGIRFFGCLGENTAMVLCPGIGLGVMFSPGFAYEAANRSFVDLSVNPFLRLILDTQKQVGLVFEAGVNAVPTRSFSTDDPVSSDPKAHIWIELTAGLILDFEGADESLFSDFGGSSSSTSFSHPGLLLGVKGGFPITTVRGTDSSGDAVKGMQGRPGTLGGLTVDVGAGTWGLAADVAYASRAYGADANTTATQDWVHVPIMARYRSPGATHIFANFGGYFAVPFGKTLTEIAGGTSSSTETTANIDYGAVLGLGLGTFAKVTTLQIELRYLYGVSNLMKDAPDNVTSKTSAVDLLVGFLF